jgi:transcriptional regulator GlxA family with amidase domain
VREKRVRECIQNISILSFLSKTSREMQKSTQNPFASLFRQSVGMTPQKFVLRQGVGHARKLLERSILPLIDIAIRCSFQDQIQLTTTFGRYGDTLLEETSAILGSYC